MTRNKRSGGVNIRKSCGMEKKTKRNRRRGVELLVGRLTGEEERKKGYRGVERGRIAYPYLLLLLRLATVTSVC